MVCGLLGSGLAVTGAVGLVTEMHDSAAAAAAGTSPSTAAPSITAAPSTTATAAIPRSPAPATLPVTLQIPSIKVDTSLELLGLADDGTLQTPIDAEQAGWYTGSSLPGRPGPVVIAGHVDSYTGPAVFAHLQQMKAGDSVTITLNGGSRVVYQVTSVDRYTKNAFPTQSVYGPRPDSELRLITCGGAFVQGHYVDNVVVYARLASAPGGA